MAAAEDAAPTAPLRAEVAAVVASAEEALAMDNAIVRVVALPVAQDVVHESQVQACFPSCLNRKLPCQGPMCDAMSQFYGSWILTSCQHASFTTCIVLHVPSQGCQ